MVSDMQGKGGKLPVIGLYAIAVIVCLLFAIAFIVIYDYGHLSYPNTIRLSFAGNGTISSDQLSATTTVLQERFKALGIGASISTASDVSGHTFVDVNYGNASGDLVKEIATMPGHFEMRIQTTGNQSAHVLNGSEITTASLSRTSDSNGTARWGATILLSPAGAQLFQAACVGYNATVDPENHTIIMLLDGAVISSAPLSTGLADQIEAGKIDTLVINAGNSDAGNVIAAKICACIASRELPVPLKLAET